MAARSQQRLFFNCRDRIRVTKLTLGIGCVRLRTEHASTRNAVLYSTALCSSSTECVSSELLLAWLLLLLLLLLTLSLFLRFC